MRRGTQARAEGTWWPAPALRRTAPTPQCLVLAMGSAMAQLPLPLPPTVPAQRGGTVLPPARSATLPALRGEGSPVLGAAFCPLIPIPTVHTATRPCLKPRFTAHTEELRQGLRELGVWPGHSCHTEPHARCKPPTPQPTCAQGRRWRRALNLGRPVSRKGNTVQCPRSVC